MGGASRAIRHWLDSVRPAMAATEENTKDQSQLLAEARQARKDALDTILEFIPEELEQEAHLTLVFPRATPLLAAALAVARRHTDEALRNIHAQLVDLAKEHVPPEQVGALFNTILQVTCSFGRRWTTWPRTRSSSRTRSFPTSGVPVGAYWKGYPSWALPAVRPAGLRPW